MAPGSMTRLEGSPLPTTGPEGPNPRIVELGPLGLDRGAHLLIERCVASVAPGGEIEVRGDDPALEIHLAAWGRRRGHHVDGCRVVRGRADEARWSDAARAGGSGPDGIVEKAPRAWGLAARGSLVESGGPDLATADLDSRPVAWCDLAPRLYAQAAASQWDPATAIDWAAPFELSAEADVAVVQIMTYLIENELAALQVPSRFVGRLHPHYREVVQLLAIQLADEARHVEVFTRRAQLSGSPLGVSSASGRASLQTLFDEQDPAVSTLLLSVLGEGTFLHLLSFLVRFAPDPVTAQVCRLALSDEARHVAFGIGHLEEQLRGDPALRDRLADAVVRRHHALRHTAGLGDETADSLIVLAAGSFDPVAIGRGFDQVVTLRQEMDEGRRRRLGRLGFSEQEAAELSSLHTRNFM
jgi:hypothetical protein